MAIDWNFIDQLESKAVLNGYVPKNKKGEVIGKSGVTIATGFDLGQIDSVYFRTVMTGGMLYNFSDHTNLIEKLIPYCGLKGEKAVQMLKVKPLKIEARDAEYIDNAIKYAHQLQLTSDWNDKSFVKFDNLPNEVQTVLFSLAYNFGAKLSKSLPQTFKIFRFAAESGNYLPAVDWLDTFPSKNPELVLRRKKEAAYLASVMKGSRNGK